MEEPIGNFNDSADAWNQVLWIAMGANIGAIFGRGFYGLFRPAHSGNSAQTKVPSWYPATRTWLWLGTLLATVVVAIVNIFYGIHQVGIVPRTILPWPLNALIAWMLNIGSALAIAVLIWWDTAENKNITLPLYAILGEAFLGTVSVISRAAFLFHAIPQLLALSRKREITLRYSQKKILLFLATFVALFLTSIAAVSFLRDYQYAASKAVRMPMPHLETNSSGVNSIKSAAPDPTESAEKVPSFRIQLIRQLVVNRWIGLEGVMAVSSYPDKSNVLLWEMLTESREAGKVSAYQKVSNSGYQITDTQYQFASMPGISGFLYYSGSLWLVVWGLAAFAAFTIASERIVFLLTCNPLLCALYGMTLANTIAQFGMTPRQEIPQFLMIYAAVLAIWFVQSRFFIWPFVKPVG